MIKQGKKIRNFTMTVCAVLFAAAVCMVSFAASYEPYDPVPVTPAGEQTGTAGRLIVPSNVISKDAAGNTVVDSERLSIADMTVTDLKYENGVTTVEMVDAAKERYVIVVTPYLKKDTIVSSESRIEITERYNEIASALSITEYTPLVAPEAAKLGLDAAECYVADMFDMTFYHVVGTTYTEVHNHGEVRITLTDDVFEKFACLLHYNKGTWEVVTTVKHVESNEISFTINDFSPFAIVVNSKTPTAGLNSGVTSPQTGYSFFGELFARVRDLFERIF